jgi:Anti-sigma-K factor rskA
MGRCTPLREDLAVAFIAGRMNVFAIALVRSCTPMADPPDPAEPPENIDDLFAAFDAGELDAEPVSDEERRRMVAAARLVPRARPGAEPPPELRARVLERIRLESSQPPAPVADLARARERRFPSRRVIAAVVAAAAAVIVAVFALNRGQDTGRPLLFDAELAAIRTGPSPAAEGGAEISRLGAGYEVRLEAEGLAPTKGNTTYVLWYVAKGDTRARPKRVAIGSFRTRDGTIDARWPAAFDSSRFTRVSITLEPRDDGDPRANGPEVATGPSLRVHGKPAQ